jgi:hypothetical protein
MWMHGLLPQFPHVLAFCAFEEGGEEKDLQWKDTDFSFLVLKEGGIFLKEKEW